jgi:histidine ammonia-lyase
MKNVGLYSGVHDPSIHNRGISHWKQNSLFSCKCWQHSNLSWTKDHVSMGSISATELNKVLDNLEYILRIELLTACQP